MKTLACVVLLGVLPTVSRSGAQAATGAASVANPAGAHAGWLARVDEAIAAREYEVSATSAGVQAPNRAQGLRTWFGEGGIQIRPRCAAEGGPAWELRLETVGFSRDGVECALSAPRVVHAGCKVRYDRGALVERYENRPDGLEQLFDVMRAPDGAGELEIRMRITGGFAEVAAADDATVSLRTAAGEVSLALSGLRVFDARGAVLPAHFAARPDELSIRIDDRGALYPLLVDPLLTNPSWSAEGNQAAAQFATSVATAGDVNADGYSDVLVGAPLFDNGQADEGMAFLYLGSASGLATTPAWSAEQNQLGAWFGTSVAGAGDVNGDGYFDAIISASSFFGGQSKEGKAFVYHGSAAGLGASAAWSVEGNQLLAFLGNSVAYAGDVNGDGYADVIVGAEGYDAGQADEGRAFVHLGSAAGLAASPVWTNEGNLASANYGGSVSTAGDVNGDGYADIVVGAQDSSGATGGAAYVYHGAAAGPATAPNWSVSVAQAGALYGASVSTAGDVNGDGYADVIVGAPLYDAGQTDEGAAFAYLGASSGLSSSAGWSGEGQQVGANYGDAVATAGDVNGDGYADVIVGVSAFDGGQADEGLALVYHGSSSGLVSAPAWSSEGNQAGARLGSAVATAGDVDGNGVSEVIVGARLYDGGQTDEGAAFVHLGYSSMPTSTAAWVVEGDQANANFGAVAEGIGDVNGDGYSDVLVSTADVGGSVFTHVYHGSTSSLPTLPSWTADAYVGTGAGDVNGDGYADVLVRLQGASSAHLHYGSPSGLSPSFDASTGSTGGGPVFTGDVDGDGFMDMYGAGIGRLYFGAPAGGYPAYQALGTNYDLEHYSPGDFNGDGFADVAFDSPFGTDLVVLRGSASGLAIATPWQLDSGGGLVFMRGLSAGDVNGDGYSDVALEGYSASNHRAQLYLGGPTGPSSSPAWTAAEPVNFNGLTVAAAGDIDGDGYSDVYVGSLSGGLGVFDTASIYRGTASGLSPTPAWTINAPQPNCWFGADAGSAGDVNGDGYTDLIVGAPYYSGGQSFEGAAFVYLGGGVSGLKRWALQARTNGVTPIALGGKSDALDSFTLKALGRSAAGRGRVRFEYEVKALGAPFTGLGLLTSAFLDTGAPSAAGSAIVSSAQPVGLTPNTYYHWRTRTQSASPLFARSRWISLPANSITESKLRTRGLPVQGVSIAVEPPLSAYCLGGAITFDADATGGTAPIGYQWRKDGVPIAGANAEVYTIAAATVSDLGSYDCVASNWEAEITSNVIVVSSLSTTPVFTLHPASVQSACAASVNFSVAVSGLPATYQWRHNLTPIAGATSSTLSIQPVVAGSVGAYDCVATNACGSTVSQPAALGIGSYSLALSQPLGPGSIRIHTSGAPPGYFYAFVFSFDPLNAIAPGYGWWSGLWVSPQQLGLCLSFGGPPFLGFLNGSGASLYELPAGALTGLGGLTLHGVTTSFVPSPGFNACGKSNVASLLLQ
jgi:hypothetical protein